MHRLFPKITSLSNKLLTLVVLNCLAFVLITTLVLVSLIQAKNLATDVANTQMSRVILNSETSRQLRVVFSEINLLSGSFDEDGDGLELTQGNLQQTLSMLGRATENPQLNAKLERLSTLLDELVEQYQATNENLVKIRQIDVAVNTLMEHFEMDTSDWLIEATVNGYEVSHVEQVISLLSGYRESLLMIGKQQALQISRFLMPRQRVLEGSAIKVIDDLLLRLQTLSASTPQVSDYGRRISHLMIEYRDLAYQLEDNFNQLSTLQGTMAAQEQELLAIIKSTDQLTNETAKVLAAELESIVSSSGVTILLLSLSVMILLVMIIQAIVKTSINQPISGIIDGIEEFRQGRLLKRIQVHGANEWGTICDALNNMAHDLQASYSELKDSEDKFYQVFENELNGLLIFEQQSGLCLEANRVALDLYGYSLREIKEVSIRDLEGTASDHCPIQNQLELFEGAEQDGWVSTSHCRRDGSRFPVEVHTGVFQRQGRRFLFKSVRDMTAQFHLQSVQKKTLSLLEATLESTNEGILALSKDGNILNYNNKFAQLFDIPPEYFCQGTGKQVLPHIFEQLQDRSNFKQLIRKSYQSASNTTSEVLELNDGRMFECHTQPQILGGEIVGRVWNFRDVSEYFSIMDELRDKESRLAHMAHHDPLTGLANRLLFVDRLEHAILKAQRGNSTLALFFIDLDRFKSINDSLGHVVGDRLLQSFAGRLQQTVRQVDTIARLGGDEFTMILDTVTSAQDAAAVACKILDSLKQPFEAGEHRFYVTSSIGISFYPQDGDCAETLLRNADAAMYRSKDEGRNTFHFYTEDMTTQALQRVQMEADLRAALQDDQFVVHFQPQYDLFSKALIGAEALVRWLHPVKGFIGPDLFLPAAEESGLIIDIDEWVFKDVCRQLGFWKRQGINLEGLRFAVNLSGGQLKREDLPHTFAEIMHRYSCDPKVLELEITEGFIMHQPDVSTRILHRLRDLGMQLSIDDFGTGYSSLSYLKRLPVNKLKIDRSFVMDIAEDPNDAAIAKSVIALGHSMNLKVVAEGIENKEQEAFLKAEGCDIGQGYLYSKPVAVAEFTELLLDPAVDKCSIIEEHRQPVALRRATPKGSAVPKGPQ